MREMLEINIDIHLQNIRKFNHIEDSGELFLSLVTSKNVFTIVIDRLENNTGDHSCYFEQDIPSQHQRMFTSP